MPRAHKMIRSCLVLMTIFFTVAVPVSPCCTYVQRKRGAEKKVSADFGREAFAEAVRLRAEWKKSSLLAAITQYQRARAYWQAAGNEREEALALKGIGEAYRTFGDNHQAIDYYRLALLLAEKREDHELQIEMLNAISYLYVDLRDSQQITTYAD